jgi:hypothetical protein
MGTKLGPYEILSPLGAGGMVGTQKIDGREAHVVAFAQRPSRATLAVTLRGREGTTVHMLVQGIA